MQVETLESRRLLSVSLNATTHLLTATGTAGNDTITFHVTSSTLKVVDNGVVHNYPASAVTKIIAYGKQGYDNLKLDSSVNIPAVLYGDGAGTSSAYSAISGDNLVGGNKNDTLYGGNNSGSLLGGAGNDRIYTGPGDTGIEGGVGNDTIFNQGHGQNSIVGGSGTDTVDYSSSTAPVRVGNSEVLTEEGAGGGAGTSSEGDFISGCENFTGGSANDRIYGTGGANVLKGGPGADFIKPLGGTDQIWGGTGTDKVSYATVDFFAVSVRITLDNAANDGYAGNNANIHADVEQIEGGDGDDYLSGSAANNVIIGGLGHDAMYGLDGNDTIYARDGDSDFISGGLGTDTARKDPFDTTTGIEVFLA
jgi:Ca2+-binding RTX toxin-like protein